MTSSPISARLSPTASSRLVVLAETVLKAGETARGSLRRRTSAEMLAKAPRDYQTEIDVAVERIIVDEMAKAFPDYAIQGEEAVGNRTAGPETPVLHRPDRRHDQLRLGHSAFWHDDLDRRERQARHGRRL